MTPETPNTTESLAPELGEVIEAARRFGLNDAAPSRVLGQGSSGGRAVLVHSAGGGFVVKRVAPSLTDPRLMSFRHGLRARLVQRRFPVPPLLRDGQGESFVRLPGGVYEACAFVPGRTECRSEIEAEDAGRTLAFFHLFAADHPRPAHVPPVTYHVDPALVDRLGSSASAGVPKLIAASLAARADTALRRVRAEGVSLWPEQTVHADWHPGNLVFDRGRVVAVLDLDSPRRGQRVVDIAFGVAHVSFVRDGPDPRRWPREADLTLASAFCRGYDRVEGCLLSTAECGIMGSLMALSLLAQSAEPLARSGRFGSIDGGIFARMLDLKTGWLLEHADRIAARLSQYTRSGDPQ